MFYRKFVQPITYQSPLELFQRYSDTVPGVLFESVDVAPIYGRKSIFFVDPVLSVEGRGKNSTCTTLRPAGDIIQQQLSGKVTTIRSILEQIQVDDPYFGLYGMFSYDFVRQFEVLPDQHPHLDVPDFHLYIPDLITDYEHMLVLFNSSKENRDVEKYSKVMLTIAHVTGQLGTDQFIAYDALVVCLNAGTLTGAPKILAMEFIEGLEPERRGLYGGCVGYLTFNNELNSGVTIRSAIIEQDTVTTQAGATMLLDSTPEAEFRAAEKTHMKKHIVLIDNFDSFTYNLVDYFRQLGATVTVLRNTASVTTVKQAKPDLIVYSPGPGNPSQSGNVLKYIKTFSEEYPQFGVCLGLQAMVEAYGGSLRVLDYPMHGKASQITHDGKTIFSDLPNPMTVGRYHSLAADLVPAKFIVSARSLDDDQVMAIRHVTLPIEAVQFHPESILTAKDHLGLQLIRTVLEVL